MTDPLSTKRQQIYVFKFFKEYINLISIVRKSSIIYINIRLIHKDSYIIHSFFCS